MTRKVRLKYSQLVRAVHVLPFLCKTCFGIASAWPKNPYHKLLRINAWNTGQTHKTQTNTQCVSASMQRYIHTHTHMHTTSDSIPLYRRFHKHNAIIGFTHKHKQWHTHPHTLKYYRRRILVVFTHTINKHNTHNYTIIRWKTPENPSLALHTNTTNTHTTTHTHTHTYTLQATNNRRFHTHGGFMSTLLHMHTLRKLELSIPEKIQTESKSTPYKTRDYTEIEQEDYKNLI